MSTQVGPVVKTRCKAGKGQPKPESLTPGPGKGKIPGASSLALLLPRQGPFPCLQRTDPLGKAGSE